MSNETSRLWKLNNQEKIKATNAEYRKNNKEKIKLAHQKYKDNNKEKIRERNAEYRKNNKEKIKLAQQKFAKSKKGIKSVTIKNWKARKVVCDDFDELYNRYCLAEYCDECNVYFDKEITKFRKCLDHDHKTGLFRNFLCHSCNVKRKW